MVMRTALVQALVGLVIGIPAAMMCVRYVASQLYEIKAIDAGTLTLAVSAMVVTAALSSFIPALRAASIDPAQALRN